MQSARRTGDIVSAHQPGSAMSAEGSRSAVGAYFEDFRVGMEVQHRRSRTVTQEENARWSLVTLNTAQAHWNQEAMKTYLDGRFERPIVNAAVVLGIAVGLTSRGHQRECVCRRGSRCRPLDDAGVRRRHADGRKRDPGDLRRACDPHSGRLRYRISVTNQAGAAVATLERTVLDQAQARMAAARRRFRRAALAAARAAAVNVDRPFRIRRASRMRTAHAQHRAADVCRTGGRGPAGGGVALQGAWHLSGVDLGGIPGAGAARGRRNGRARASSRAGGSPSWAIRACNICSRIWRRSSIGAIPYGIYPTSSSSEVAFLLEHGGARIVFAGDQEHLDKLLGAERQTARRLFDSIVLIDDRTRFLYDDPRLISFSELERARGRRHARPGGVLRGAGDLRHHGRAHLHLRDDRESERRLLHRMPA